MILITIDDVEELNSKLVSEKAKIREEGLKTLQGYLNSTSDLNLWSLLDQETSLLDQSRIRSSSWPGVLHALCVCIDNEVAANKKKAPKPLLSKILRSFVLKAEDSSRPGQSLGLLRKVRRLFQHIVETLQRAPSFVSDYNNVLCQLLPVFEYRMRMGKKIYADLLHFYMEKAKDVARITVEASLMKEEAFRNVSTLLALLQHPPGDLPVILLSDITQDFMEIFTNLRDEGRIAKKLLAALNAFLIGNGLNIGDAVTNIHGSLKSFMVRVWFTTRDRELKDVLVLYIRVQLKLRHILLSGDNGEVSNLLELVEKDLDQGGILMTGLHRLDAGREEKVGFVTKALHSFLELAATVLFEASKRIGCRMLNISKRRRKADINNVIKDQLVEGKYMWNGAFCLLIRRFGSRLPIGVILDWLEGLTSSLDRILLEGVNSRNYEGPMWTLRSLQELGTLLGRTLRTSKRGGCEMSFAQIVQDKNSWKSVWSVLLHWLPLLSNVQVMVEEVFRLLGVIAAQNLVPICSVPEDFWDLRRFTEPPSGNLLYFIIAFFISTSSQITNCDLEIRKKLLDWCLGSLDPQEVHRTRYIFGEQLSSRLLATAVVALAFGAMPGTVNSEQVLRCLREDLSWPSSEAEPYLEPDESEYAQELDLVALDRSHDLLLSSKDPSTYQDVANAHKNQLPRLVSDVLLQKATYHLLRNVNLALDACQSFSLSQLLHLSTIVATCVQGVESSTERWGQLPSDWCPEGPIWEGLANILEKSVAYLDDISKVVNCEKTQPFPSTESPGILNQRSCPLLNFTSTTVQSLKQFVANARSCTLVASRGVLANVNGPGTAEPLLIRFLKVAQKAFSSAREVAVVADKTVYACGGFQTAEGHIGISQDVTDNKRIVDLDLDVSLDSVVLGGGNVTESGSVVSVGMTGISTPSAREKVGDLRSGFLQVIAVIGKVMPDAACASLVDLLLDERDLKVQGDILLSLCKTINVPTCQYLTVVMYKDLAFFMDLRRKTPQIRKMQDALSECQQNESMRYHLLNAMDAFFTSLLRSEQHSLKSGSYCASQERRNLTLPTQVSLQVAELIGKIVNMGLLFWPTRVKLVNAISQFIVIDPNGAQVLTEKFLAMLHDADYRVRVSLSRKIAILFETWDGHDELFQDVCGNFGVKMAMVNKEGRFAAGEVLQSPPEVTMAETALLSLREIAIASEDVENDVVFMICAHVSLNPSSKPLVCAVFDKVGKQLNYPSRFKYIEQLLAQLLTQWVISRIEVRLLLELAEVIVHDPGEKEFLHKCCPSLLPWLIFYGDSDQIQWLATILCLSTPVLVKQHFESILSGILPLHLGTDKGIQSQAAEALQVSTLELAEVSEDERDVLIQKKMVPIVSTLLGLCSAREKPQLPYFTKERIVAAIKTVVDGFLDSDQVSQEVNVIDKMQVFRPDRVFKLLLELHSELSRAFHPRHRRNVLRSVEALIDILDMRAVIPSTFRYLVLIILQSMASDELEEQCCILMTVLLDKLYCSGHGSSDRVLGEQLQAIVSKLVSCYLSACGRVEAFKSSTSGILRSSSANIGVGTDSQRGTSVMTLLRRLTVDNIESLSEYIKDLDPFPELPCFEPIQACCNKLSAKRTLAEEFLQFVRKVPELPSELRLSSLHYLHKQLRTRQKELYSTFNAQEEEREQRWRCATPVVGAVWKLLQLCAKHNDLDMDNLAGEFLAAVGVVDPHAVVFHLPEKEHVKHIACLEDSSDTNKDDRGFCDISIDPELGLSENLLRCIIIELRAYLIDPDVHVIHLAYDTLKGILSTEEGQRAFLTLDQEKTYLEMYLRGVNLKLVKDMVAASKQRSSRAAFPLDDPNIWQTSGKTYDVWICTLTHSLLEYTGNTTLRLCQEMVAIKSPLAELLFPHVLGSLAGEYGSTSQLCSLMSSLVEEHLFNTRNQSTRSIQLFLNTFNSLRQCYIKSGTRRVSATSKRKDSGKSLTNGGSGRSRLRDKELAVMEKVLDAGASSGACTGGGSTSWKKVYWLHVDYLSTARAAQQCAAYFTSILYVEHWCEESFGSATLGPPDFSSEDELPLHLELLVRAYTRINEPDGIYGVVRSHKVPSQLLRYEHEGNWSKALDNYDLLLRSNNPPQTRGQSIGLDTDMKGDSRSLASSLLHKWQLHKGLMRSLQQKGCSHILDMYRSGVSQQEKGLGSDAEFKEMQFEAAWRSGSWDDIDLLPNTLENTTCALVSGNKESCYHAHLYSSLKSLVEGDFDTFVSHSKLARQEIVRHFAHTSMESTQNVNPLIVKLQILDYVSQAWELRWSLCDQPKLSMAAISYEQFKSTIVGPLVPSNEQIVSLEAIWQENLSQMQGHYELAEPYIAIRKVLLQLLHLNDHIPQHLLQFASFARKAGRLNHAGNAIHELKSICIQTVGALDASKKTISQIKLPKHCVAGRVEEAKILWAEGHQEMAVNLAKFVLQLEHDGTDISLLLCLTGKWLAETRSSSARVILDSYLKRAVELSESSNEESLSKQRTIITSCRTHFRLAHYADALFRNHQGRLMSSEWQAALRLRQHKAREYEALKERLEILKADPLEDFSKIREYSMKMVELQRQLVFDVEEAKHMQNDKDHFLSIALKSYGYCLCISSKYELRVVFRLISLWFNLSSNEDVVVSMVETVQKVSSYKFLPLVYQIASRLGSSKDSSKEQQGSSPFQKAVTLLLKKMATEHPYHSLFQLFALANGDRVKEKQRGKHAFVVDMDKKRAAEELLGSLTVQHHDLLLQVKKMIEIYIRLAEMETTQKEANKRVPIPREIRSIRQLELVPVVTAELPVDHSCQYPQGSFPHFKGFSEGIKIMNGINAPKYIECLGSDGNKYRQLAKSGNDDLRQDAVMEQLFGLVNKLLQDHPDTRKRNLGIRTYKVVPFTPSAGVLEWVDGTIPLGEYLLGSNRTGGAHARYGGDDWSFLTCRDHMSKAKDKRTAFETVMENFCPVMHYFFLENFGQAEDWFEKRLSYTRSVATSSMVGYIVGLGDRHSMNMLLDQATAEVVHIDLGVAFEQGLMLKTPERIPFRLTRDVVDGMGVTGVEGVFRRCCEATLSVLRTNKEALLTIIEVFIYDPLYNWALSPLKALQRQQELEDLEDSSQETDNMVEMEGNKDAARALFRVKQKLDGYEEGEMRSLQGQVQQLIQNAQDPERLSELFPGWGAWV